MSATKGVTISASAGSQWDNRTTHPTQGITAGTNVNPEGRKASLFDTKNPREVMEFTQSTYPLLSERVNLCGEAENDPVKRLKLFKQIDRNFDRGKFTSWKLKPADGVDISTESLVFHGSKMYSRGNSYIAQDSIEQNGKRVLFKRPDGVSSTDNGVIGNLACAVNDKYYAINVTSDKGTSSQIEIYDCTSGQLIGTISFDNVAVSALCFDCQGNLIAGTHSGKIYKITFSKAEDSKDNTKEKTEGLRSSYELVYRHSSRVSWKALSATKSYLHFVCVDPSDPSYNFVGNFDWAEKDVAFWPKPVKGYRVDKIIPRSPLGPLVRVDEDLYALFESTPTKVKNSNQGGFCLSDTRMFTIWDGRLNVTAPFDFDPNPNIGNAPAFQEDVTPPGEWYSKDGLIRFLHCDGAKVVFLHQGHSERGDYFRRVFVWDFAGPIFAEKAKVKVKDSSADEKESSASSGSN